MEVSGSATSCFFPLVKNIQPFQSVLEQYLKAFGISQLSCMFFFKMDTVKSQEGPGVLDLRSRSEEM